MATAGPENNSAAHHPHHSRSGSYSDSEDDQILSATNNARELAEHDRGLIREEEERENLLSSSKSTEKRKFFGKRKKAEDFTPPNNQRARRNVIHKNKKRKHKAASDEEGELMYEMEEGGPTSEISSQASTSSVDLDMPKLDLSTSNKHQLRNHASVATSIMVLFLLLVFGAYKMSQNPVKNKVFLSTLSNGTTEFAPTTILISLDGFRADFLQRGLTPTLNSFITEGVSPKYMLPSFPSVTFPNHYTLVTGLHPESHGIVGNSFWDPHMKEDFYYTDPSRSMQPKWWSAGEPLWVTAEKQNVTTAIHMWPGSEAHISLLEPTFLDKFNGTEELSRKVDRVLELIDTPGIEGGPAIASRPQFIAAYVPVVDADGHLYGPNSTEIRSTIKNVDSMLYNLFKGLDQRNLTKIVNIVVVSDHGMATTSINRLIQLDDIIDLNLIERIDGWPLYGLRPKDLSNLPSLHNRLLAEAKEDQHFEVYLKENMPERYHFSHNDRIAPLWVIPKTGWAIVHKKDFDVKKAKANGEVYHPKGLHGYDHEHPLMRSIFVARGPAFPHKPNRIEPKANNGTLRLPLKPVGLHSNHSASVDDVSEDLPSEAEITVSAPATAQSTQLVASSPSPSIASNSSGRGTKEQATAEAHSGVWAFVTGSFSAIKDWAKGLMSKLRGSESDRYA
ncbi:MAG: hypothetical protein LQ342_004749 [Letrouitia transgressa]|nr:MAG: hypothetical protein LQ342_004749 [Letrouitia transgressa]